MKKAMRKTGMILSITMLLIGMAAWQAHAQRGNPDYRPKERPSREAFAGFHSPIPDLTKEQIEQIDVLRTQYLKETTPLRNQLEVKRAELKALMSGEDADMDDIDSKIDEITVLKAELLKQHAAHIQDFRNILTEKQRIHFDAKKNKRMGRHHDKGQRRTGFRNPHPPFGIPDEDFNE